MISCKSKDSGSDQGEAKSSDEVFAKFDMHSSYHREPDRWKIRSKFDHDKSLEEFTFCHFLEFFDNS